MNKTMAKIQEGETEEEKFKKASEIELVSTRE